MREISIAGRTVTVSLVATTHGEDGDIQRYLVEVSGSDAATHLSILRMTSAVDARAMASAIELLYLSRSSGFSFSGSSSCTPSLT